MLNFLLSGYFLLERLEVRIYNLGHLSNQVFMRKCHAAHENIVRLTPLKRWLRMTTHCKPVLLDIAKTQSDWSSYDRPAYPYANSFEPVPIIQCFPAILRNAGKL